MLGAMQLVGRLAFAPAMKRLARPQVTTCAYALFFGGLLVLGLTGHRGSGPLWAFVVIFGTARGMLTLIRATLVAELYGPAHYGSIVGAMTVAITPLQAAAPFAIGVAHDAAGSYDAVIWASVLLAAGSTFMASRIEARHRDE